MARHSARRDSTLDDILDNSDDACPECGQGHCGFGFPAAVEDVVSSINGIPVLYLERPTIGDGH